MLDMSISRHASLAGRGRAKLTWKRCLQVRRCAQPGFESGTWVERYDASHTCVRCGAENRRRVGGIGHIPARKSTATSCLCGHELALVTSINTTLAPAVGHASSHHSSPFQHYYNSSELLLHPQRTTPSTHLPPCLSPLGMLSLLRLRVVLYVRIDANRTPATSARSFLPSSSHLWVSSSSAVATPTSSSTSC